MRTPPQKKQILLLALALTVAVVAVYGQVWTFKLIRYDDTVYVAENPQVLAGLSREGVLWAFLNTDEGFWHPLTWLSLMLDAQLYGFRSGGYHGTNAILHLGSTLLLFCFLLRVTGAPRRSAVVAALFALHPLNVEPVAWVALRKDVLSTFFAMATLLSYGHYAARPRLSAALAVLVLFCLGLMAKPMIVTLPFVMLLLDVWPLRRLGPSWVAEPPAGEGPTFPTASLRGVILEKVPLLLLSAAASILVVVTEQKAGALSSLDVLPMTSRVANAVVSYAAYLGKWILPVNLAFFYPHPVTVPAGALFLSLAVLAGISFLMLRKGRSFPYLAVGWLWFLGMLVPVIGLVQVGPHALADRYTYLPMIGIHIAAVWGVADLTGRWGVRESVAGASALILLVALASLSWFQLQHWRNSFTLFEHALRVTRGNYIAANNLGLAWYHEGNVDKALVHFRLALEMNREYALVYSNLGSALFQKGEYREAETYFREAVRRSPSEGGFRYNLGRTLCELGLFGEAVFEYREALRLGYRKPDTYTDLGVALLKLGLREEGTRMLGKALELDPGNARAQEQWKRVVGR